jgi:tetratricopeptide (TPR) repeat protein
MVKLRTLEIACQGAFQLCEQCEDLADYYVDGEEIVSYRDWDHLVELIKKYGADARRREQIGLAGYEATKRNHVWTVRWAEIERLAAPLVERYRPNQSKPAPPDIHLPQELGLSACASHYEKAVDVATATVAIDEWLALSPTYYTSLLAKGRLYMADRKYDDAERYFKSALDAAVGLCPRAVDSTVTQRKLGQRLGMGRVFPGIFPREVETYCHLLMLYAIQDREADAERLMSKLAAISHDVLFISIVSMIAEPQIDKLIGPKYLARYVEVVIASDPAVWAGERTRHLAHFWMLRGQSFMILGRRDEARECLEYALTQNPYPKVADQIRATLGQLGVR